MWHGGRSTMHESFLRPTTCTVIESIVLGVSITLYCLCQTKQLNNICDTSSDRQRCVWSVVQCNAYILVN